MKSIGEQSLRVTDDAEDNLAGGQQAIDNSTGDGDSFDDPMAPVNYHPRLFRPG